MTALNLTNDVEVIALVRECLEKEGMLKEVIRFKKRLTDVLHSKEKMVRLVVQHLGIPRNEAQLEYTDIRAGTASYAPI